MNDRLAVVTIARGRHQHLTLQHRSLSTGSRLPACQVVVAMGDEALAGWDPARGVPAHVVPMAADPTALPLAAARNRGARAALEAGADALVFLDVDCLAGVDLVAAYARAVRARPDVVWSGPVTYLDPAPVGGYDLDRLAELDAPHPARPDPGPGKTRTGADADLFWSLSFAVGAEAWERTGGFCEEYVGYGGEDTDFGQVVLAKGLDLGWVGDARAYHQHHPTQDPPVQHLRDIVRNAAIFHRRWGRWPMRGWLEEFARRGLVGPEETGWRPVGVSQFHPAGVART